MSERTRTAGILALILALTAYAYAPLLSTGFLGDDYRVLLSVDEAGDRLGYLYRYTGMTGAETAAHIHGFAAPGSSAGVLHTLPAGPSKTHRHRTHC